MLVALLLLLVFTLRTTVVSIFSSTSCPLVVVISMVFINNPGVMSNNTNGDNETLVLHGNRSWSHTDT